MALNQGELIRRIASVVGHELRNPLAVINNSAYFVKTKLSQGKLDAKVEKHLGIIAAEVARADKIIGRMVAYSRPIEFKATSGSLAACVEAALAEAPLPDGVTLDKKLKDVMLALDVALVTQAARDLIDNAVEAMDGKGRLSVAVGLAGGRPELRVADSGPGLPAGKEKDIFEPFFTTKPKGLGLGLASAHRTAEAHGAVLSAEKGPGGGAVFRLVWPACGK